ncbi:unnamed protein product [Owenia fusiformis]|uniref:Uncharacterized protein n=1 Tax=Owenia fusiformis TaxID=6347 RepID=A0A8S4NSK6_OWEFU|nr:unnamed protein product [Owenia fusiformis]
MAFKRVYCLIEVSLLCSTAYALRCYQCVDVFTSSNVISTVGHTDFSCEYPSSSTATTTCRKGEVCGYVNGKVEASVNLIFARFKVTITIHARDCMSVEPGTSMMTCYKNKYYSDAINKALSFISGLVDITFDGDVCFCNAWSYCEPPDSWIWWAIGGGAAGFIVMVILLSLCCYFYCCKKRVAPQPIIMHSGGTMAPGTSTVTYVNGGYTHGGMVSSHRGPIQTHGPAQTHGPIQTIAPIQPNGTIQSY